VVRAGTVCRAGKKLATTRDDADADKSVSSCRVQPLFIHAIKTRNAQPQTDFVGHHYTDESNPILQAVINSTFMLHVFWVLSKDTVCNVKGVCLVRFDTANLDLLCMGGRRIFSRGGQIRVLGMKVPSRGPGMEPWWLWGPLWAGWQIVKIMHK